MSSPILTRRGAQQAKIQTRGKAMQNNTTPATNSNATKSANAPTSKGAAATSTVPRKPNPALLEAKRKARLLKMEQAKSNNDNDVVIAVTDIFQNARNAKKLSPKDTAIVYDQRMENHNCLWDKEHPESPERYSRILQRCTEMDLLNRCTKLVARPALKSEILLLHSEHHYDSLEAMTSVRDDATLEHLSARYDSIYIHPETFKCALLAAGSTLDLIDTIVRGRARNGMAIVRPPGHHAMENEYNGYCFFNNVALAAKYALNTLKLQKVLIIDWDVHHGQGTQRFFYDNPNVLYFSIHRFEYGKFWPHLRESDFDAIGTGAGLGYNFNLPLNKIGMTNGDYLAIFQQILIPIAIEYQPELIIISAGYDAALGCPEGEMEITPACYAHLLHPLMNLAHSRVAVVLEGGYCVDSLAEGAALTLAALLGDPCPLLVEPLQPPCKEIQDTILNCITTHREYWRCLQLHQVYTQEELTKTQKSSVTDLHGVRRIFIGGPPKMETYPTRGTAPVIAADKITRNAFRLQKLKQLTELYRPAARVCYAYDVVMLQHRNKFDVDHPEQPNRIAHIYEMFKEFGLLERMSAVELRFATESELSLAHTHTHINFMEFLSEKDALESLAARYNSVYLHPKTYESASAAAGSVLEVVEQVLFGITKSGVCVVRPPGHHAESDKPHGFCIFNNVAIAAKYAIRDFKLKRVLIVDWDVHHGNGTQHIFESNPNVLYISLHRYEHGTFFPKGIDGNYDKVGKGAGKGYNVNIPWNKKGMGDLEYVLAFQNLVMPIAYEFNPELVLVSAGFDAAIGDPLGGCKVTPECYGLLTHWLSALAKGRIIVCLEGGYNINSIAYAMTMCTKALLGDPIPTIMPTITHKTALAAATLSCIETLQNCQSIQKHYWKSLVFNKRLPCENNNDEQLIIAGVEQLVLQQSQATTKVDMSINVVEERDYQQPSSSKPRIKVKTMKEFFAENADDFNNERLFAIFPLSSCPHLNQLGTTAMPQSFDITQPCKQCNTVIENWVCLTCFKVLCGRYINEHMSLHNQQLKHPMALSFADLSVWCYICESYVDNRRLYKYKNLAHRCKFGEDMPWTYNVATNVNVNGNANDYELNSADNDDYDDYSDSDFCGNTILNLDKYN